MKDWYWLFIIIRCDYIVGSRRYITLTKWNNKWKWYCASNLSRIFFMISMKVLHVVFKFVKCSHATILITSHRTTIMKLCTCLKCHVSLQTLMGFWETKHINDTELSCFDILNTNLQVLQSLYEFCLWPYFVNEFVNEFLNKLAIKCQESLFNFLLCTPNNKNYIKIVKN